MLPGRQKTAASSPSAAERRCAWYHQRQSVASASGGDAEIVEAALEGLVQGFIADKRDTATLLGLLVYVGVFVGGGLAVDYSARRAAEKMTAMRKAIEDR